MQNYNNFLESLLPASLLSVGKRLFALSLQ